LEFLWIPEFLGRFLVATRGCWRFFLLCPGHETSRKALLRTCSAHAYHRSERVDYQKGSVQHAQCFAQIPSMISHKTANSFYFLTFSASSMDQL
jgi:hypothetical protein